MLFGENADMLRQSRYQLLLLANVNAALGTVLVSPMLEALTGPFGVSEVEAGLMITMFTAPSVIGIPLVGILADKYGRKPILVTGLLLFGLAGIGIAFVTNFQIALGLRMVQGIGYAGITPIVITSIGDLYSQDQEATAQGLRFTSSGAIQATFPLLAGVIVTIAWQYPFLLYAIALPIAGAVFFWLEEPARAETDGGTGGGSHGLRSYVRDLFWVLKHPRVISVMIAIAIPAFLYIGFLAYNSFLVVRVLGETPREAGALITVVSLVYGTAASQAGRITAFFGSRAIPLVGANVMMGVGMGAFALAPSMPIAYSGVAIMGVGTGLAFSLLRSVITGLAPKDLRGGLVGIGESTIRLANSIAPVVMGASIAFIQMRSGFDTSVRLTILGIGVGGALIGVVAILAAKAFPEVSDAR